MEVKIKEDAFKGLTHLNGMIAVLDINPKTNEVNKGVTGQKFFRLPNGGYMPLTEDEYEVI